MTGSSRVEFRTRDGVTLRGDFYKAEGEATPIAVMANGFSLVKEIATPFALQFQAAGISALAFDYRNYGSSDGMPRQETDLYQQAKDFSDAITAAMDLPGVDPAKVIMWGIGHGGSVAMIAGVDPRIKAVIFHAPFPSGKLDQANFPDGLLDRAWRDRELKTRDQDASPTYEKVWRDWMNDGDGDDDSVFIGGVAGFGLSSGNKAMAEAAGTPWENQVTLQTFINIAGTETQDFVYKIKHPALYIVHQDDPFAAPPEVHAKIFERMGPNATFEVVHPKPDQKDFNEQMEAAVAFQLKWLRSQL